MPIYYCELCNFTTSLKGDYKRHTKTKKHSNKMNAKFAECKNMVMNTNEHEMNTNEHKMNTNEHKMNTKKTYNICEYCEKEFNTRASKRRHELHYCKKNPAIINKVINEKNKKIKLLEKEKAELYKKVSMLLEKVGDTNIQNNIILNNYGNEDLSHITDAIKSTLLKIPYGAIPKLIEKVHFNNEKPENKNIVLPNKNEKLVKVFDGDKWIYKDKGATITDLVDSKYMLIDDHYENNKTDIPIKVEKEYDKFRKFYDEGDEAMVNSLKKECELVLLNHRE